MSSYFKAWNSLISGPDPDSYTPEYPSTVGQMADGKPVAQGREAGTLAWNNITLASWIDLRDRYNTNKDSSGTFVIPPHASGGSWSSWRSVTAYAEHPQAVYQGEVVQQVTMRIIIVG